MPFFTPSVRQQRRSRRFVAFLLLVACLGLSFSGTAQTVVKYDGPDAVAKPEAADAFPLIRLNYVTFNPLSDQPTVPDSLQVNYQDRNAPHYYIVQFNGPVYEDWKAAVVKAGGSLYDYIPDYAFIVRMDGKTREAVANLRFVRWVGDYQPAYKLSPELTNVSSKQLTLNILTFGNDKGREVADSLGVPVTSVSAGVYGSVLRATADSDAALALAQREDISWIEVYHAPTMYNDVARGITGANNVWTGLNLYGTNQIVAVADTGLDTGSLSTLSPDFAGRIVSTYALGRSGNWSDTQGHGTHVAGSVLGNGSRSGSDPATRNYASSFAGMAPEARLVFQSLLDSSGGLGGLPADLNTLFQQAYNDGARIHTNSWGSAVAGVYDASSQQVDQFMWAHKDMTILFAAGNEGIDANRNGVVDADSTSSPATAKNDITVGASENNRASGGYATSGWGSLWPSDYPTEPIKSDKTSNNINGMAAFSSRGPTNDGRIEPSISSPGTNILSVKSQAPGVGNAWGAYNTYYMYSGGTSMATPLTAGGAVLVRQFYTDRQGVTSPSAALIKATMLNAASDMNPGQYGTGTTKEMGARPNNVEGWGRMNLASSLNPTAPAALAFDDSKSVATGATQTFNYNVSSSSVPLRITLAWTDYAASTSSSRQLVNNLNLSVVLPNGTTVWGNGVANGDILNTVETVDIAAPATGSYTVRVNGLNVPQGGSQPFALVVHGAVSSGPAPTPTNTPVVPPTATNTPVPPTPTPGGGGCTQLVANGGFEGTASWTQSSSGGYQIVDSTRPRSGSSSAYLAGYNNANDQIWQTVTIPAGSTSATLAFYYYITTQETSHPYDYLYARIRNSSGGTLTTLLTRSDANATTSWQSASFNVAAYAGQTIQVYFQGTTDSSMTSSFFVDDVTLNACN